jgi:tRNA-binding EMAP/Myf-like protein
MISYAEFRRAEMRVGRVVVEEFPEAWKPSYKLTIDFEKETEN